MNIIERVRSAEKLLFEVFMLLVSLRFAGESVCEGEVRVRAEMTIGRLEGEKVRGGRCKVRDVVIEE